MEFDWLDDPLEFGPSNRLENDIARRGGHHDVACNDHLARCRGTRDARSKVDRVAKDVAVAQDQCSGAYPRMDGWQARLRTLFHEVKGSDYARSRIVKPEQDAVAEQFHEPAAVTLRDRAGDLPEAHCDPRGFLIAHYLGQGE